MSHGGASQYTTHQSCFSLHVVLYCTTYSTWAAIHHVLDPPAAFVPDGQQPIGAAEARRGSDRANKAETESSNFIIIIWRRTIV